MNYRWLLRASKWARRPPSERRVKLVLVVIAIALAIIALEKLGLWPDWATMDRRPDRLRLRP